MVHKKFESSIGFKLHQTLFLCWPTTQDTRHKTTLVLSHSLKFHASFTLTEAIRGINCFAENPPAKIFGPPRIYEGKGGPCTFTVCPLHLFADTLSCTNMESCNKFNCHPWNVSELQCLNLDSYSNLGKEGCLFFSNDINLDPWLAPLPPFFSLQLFGSDIITTTFRACWLSRGAEDNSNALYHIETRPKPNLGSILAFGFLVIRLNYSNKSNN